MYVLHTLRAKCFYTEVSGLTLAHGKYILIWQRAKQKQSQSKTFQTRTSIRGANNFICGRNTIQKTTNERGMSGCACLQKHTMYILKTRCRKSSSRYDCHPERMYHLTAISLVTE